MHALIHSSMALLPTLIILHTIFTTTSQASHHPIHLLKPKYGSGGGDFHGVSCSSWRLAVETNNLHGWTQVPTECEGYVGHYMLGDMYHMDMKIVAQEAAHYVQGIKLKGDGKEIWVFDIDETTLSSLPYYAKHGFGAEPYNSTAYDQWVETGRGPALPESLKLYRKILSLGIKVVFLTGRSAALRTTTVKNLHRAGYHTWERLLLREASDLGTTGVAYKSYQRRKLEEEGYRIVGNMGDQWSDILGTPTGDRTFKVPDPMYYIS